MDGLWYSFLDYLASPAGSDGAAMQELERRLRAIKEHLSARGAGPYLQGADISAQDMCLAPRLHHILTALPFLKVCANAVGWTIPGPLATTCRAVLADRHSDCPAGQQCSQSCSIITIMNSFLATSSRHLVSGSEGAVCLFHKETA